MPVLQPKDPRDLEGGTRQKTLTLPKWLAEKVDELSESLGYTPNEAIKEVLRQWVDETDAKQATNPKKSSNK